MAKVQTSGGAEKSPLRNVGIPPPFLLTGSIKQPDILPDNHTVPRQLVCTSAGSQAQEPYKMSAERVIVSTSCPACGGVPTAIPTATASGRLKPPKPGEAQGNPTMSCTMNFTGVTPKLSDTGAELDPL